MLRQWKQLTSKVVHENPWWTYIYDTFQIADDIRGEYYYVQTNGSSMIVPITDDGRIVLVNQYRYLGDRESIELPCGGVKKGKTPAEMAKIELEEETGYTCSTLTCIGSFNPFNGVTNEMCDVFIARGLTPVIAECDVTEEFEVLTRTPAEIDGMIVSHEIWDGMTLAALAMARTILAQPHTVP